MYERNGECFSLYVTHPLHSRSLGAPFYIHRLQLLHLLFHSPFYFTSFPLHSSFLLVSSLLYLHPSILTQALQCNSNSISVYTFDVSSLFSFSFYSSVQKLHSLLYSPVNVYIYIHISIYFFSIEKKSRRVMMRCKIRGNRNNNDKVIDVNGYRC